MVIFLPQVSAKTVVILKENPRFTNQMRHKYQADRVKPPILSDGSKSVNPITHKQKLKMYEREERPWLEPVHNEKIIPGPHSL